MDLQAAIEKAITATKAALSTKESAFFMVVSLHLACLQKIIKIITEIRIDFHGVVYSFFRPLSNVKSPQNRGLKMAGRLSFVTFTEAMQSVSSR